MPSREKLVALALERFMSADLSDARPSVRRLHELTGLAERTVQRCLQALVLAGWIVAVEPARQHRATTYQGRIPDTPEAGSGVRTGVSRGANREIQGCHSGTRSRRTDPVTSDPGTRNGHPLEPRPEHRYLDEATR